MNNDLNVIVLNDICSYGKVSLTINIPVLSAFSIKVSPLPTVLLSNHTQYSSFCAFDLTDYLFKIVEELKLRDAKFDAFYIGWLGHEKQVDLAVSIIKDFNIPLTMVDPILGDNEHLYTPITDKNVENMIRLLKHADIVIPNTTEFNALLSKPLDKKPSLDEIKSNIKELEALGPKKIVVTSIEVDGKVGSLCSDNGKMSEYLQPKVPIHIPGTGDAFGSALLGYMLKGASLEEATDKATLFMYKSVKAAKDENDDRIFGIAIEKRLSLL